ncbi:hypothetical protein DWU98_07300 [Dyella monticola]|uniref:HEAT repeat domain-containing protein n=1 Tax=Dyella monticola TaxID=1927958 RepID=A0A370X3E3_9GAMM|nr:hypothetical protein [Dyella monticola]RDS82933.1 hypothetical protein DWU98_07300 [Dyella monticola]
MTKYFLLGIALSLPAITLAAQPITTPVQVAAAIEREGAGHFFASLDDQASEQLFDKIEGGNADWVALAPKLALGADGANAEGLVIALAYALPRNPSVVLKIVDPVEGDRHILAISRVCGIPFIEEVPKDYKVKALRAVASAKGVDTKIQSRCLEALSKS